MLKAFQGRLELERGTLRSGLEPGGSERDRYWFHSWGTGDDGRRTDKNDCFLTGHAWTEPGATYLALVDDDRSRNLRVTVETREGCADLVITNPGRSGEAALRLHLGPVAELPDSCDLGTSETRLVVVRTEGSATFIDVGTWANDTEQYELRDGTLRPRGAHDVTAMLDSSLSGSILEEEGYLVVGNHELATRTL